MEKNGWERNIEFWERYYYLHPVWFCCMSIALIAGIRYYRNEKLNFHFLAYTIAGLLIFLATQVVINFFSREQKTTKLIIEISNVLFCTIEFLTFYIFFYQIFNFKYTKLIMSICFVLLLILETLFFIKIQNTNFTTTKIMRFSFYINVVEFFFLLLPCLLFFYNLLTRKKTESLNSIKSPSFWITTGLFFYISISLPFLLIADTLLLIHRELYNAMFAIHFLSISILFLCIAKAFSCKAPLTT